MQHSNEKQVLVIQSETNQPPVMQEQKNINKRMESLNYENIFISISSVTVYIKFKKKTVI